MLRISLTAYRETGYWFCSTRECPVVYFSDDGTQVFEKADVRETVYQKEPQEDDTPICYCFAFKVGDIENPEYTQRILSVIEEGIRAGQCACDWRNPQGNCCLGNVRLALPSNARQSFS
jgi:hypothetical protein